MAVGKCLLEWPCADPPLLIRQQRNTPKTARTPAAAPPPPPPLQRTLPADLPFAVGGEASGLAVWRSPWKCVDQGNFPRHRSPHRLATSGAASLPAKSLCTATHSEWSARPPSVLSARPAWGSWTC